MTIRFNTAMRDAMVTALTNAIGGYTLSIYTGSQPATANDAATGTKLVDITINGFNTPANGSATLNTSTPNTGTAVATGTAGWDASLEAQASASTGRWALRVPTSRSTAHPSPTARP